jgi:hypothetical protein
MSTTRAIRLHPPRKISYRAVFFVSYHLYSHASLFLLTLGSVSGWWRRGVVHLVADFALFQLFNSVQ